MKLPLRILVILIIIFGLVLISANRPSIVFASKSMTFTTLDPTPVSTQTIIAVTATVDPARIGDTSGVIAIGMIVVFIILAGVLWGSLELRQESVKNSQPKE